MEYSIGEVLSMVGTLLLMIAVFVGSYYVSKLVGKRYSLHDSGASKKLKVIESTPVGKDSAIMVIKAGERVYLIGTTPRELTFLSELDAESFPDTPGNEIPRQSFGSILRSAISGKNSGSQE